MKSQAENCLHQLKERVENKAGLGVPEYISEVIEIFF